MIEGSLTIGEAAEATGLATSTIRYYERRGILPRALRVGGRRRYDSETLRQLTAIRIAKQAGFSLEEIKQMAISLGDSERPSKLWTGAAADRLEQIEALIERAEAMRETLRRGLGCGCEGLGDCRLVEVELQSELRQIAPAAGGCG
jgi:MerR family redox-sensitive transcriptional activator SoxR